jgi:type VI protein secretion system component VasK
MDISDRIESRDFLVAMPERVAVVIREWIVELLQRAFDRDAVVEAVRLRDALLTRSLRPARLPWARRDG